MAKKYRKALGASIAKAGQRLFLSCYEAVALGATKPEWPPRGFLRRVFWVKPHDRSEDPGGIYAHDCPTEAVDPRTVAPGQEGYVTIRARGRSEADGKAQP
ncbi:hypothetical protein HCN51_57465 [Nonomuraea sp. FMUSA5-5]|uniref:Uncharacterized protein n=1 Tax=Nonomuraea composti TaxID=2720023 RepID=A0ABX1BRP8_9ACTN|nr:DUF6009 family protein [Nonomuraea sp. FMUSA5-5]NJP98907.1 hypothetical protein [Nonomuraea sp. FMUSA5-5]